MSRIGLPIAPAARRMGSPRMRRGDAVPTPPIQSRRGILATNDDVNGADLRRRRSDALDCDAGGLAELRALERFQAPGAVPTPSGSRTVSFHR